MEGRVEVYDDRKKQWGVVCADGFGLLETMTVCRQAGSIFSLIPVSGTVRCICLEFRANTPSLEGLVLREEGLSSFCDGSLVSRGAIFQRV